MRKFLALFVLLSWHSLYAQPENLNALSRENYIEQFNDYFFLWPVLKQKTTSFTLQKQHNLNQKLVYRPNARFLAGFGAYMFGIGVQLVVPLPQDNASILQRGKTRALDLQGNIIGKNWVIDVFTQNYRGYYVEDSNHPVAPASPELQRGDIRTSNTGVTGIYFFNKLRFSIRSTTNYFERQLKSSGSFLISGNLNTFSLHADSVIYPAYDMTVFGPGADFNKLHYTALALAPGYAYNLIIARRVFISGALAIGPALNWFYYNSGTVTGKYAIQVSTYADFRFSFGYNGERFFTGLTANFQSRNAVYEGLRFTSTNEVVKFAVGYRFRATGILKKNIHDLFKPKGE